VGSATVTATSEGVTGSAAISVANVPVASVVVSPVTAAVFVGATVQFTATLRDAAGNVLLGRSITWASSAAAATVSATGLVTGVAAGSVTITATSEGKTGSAAVTVNVVPVASVSLSPAATSVQVGQTVQLTATLLDANGLPLSGRLITWASSSAAVAAVSGGFVTGITSGTVTITATSEGKSGTATVTVTPAPPPPPGGSWPNEPAGYTLVTDFGWDALNTAGWLNATASDITNGKVAIVTDNTAPLSPPYVLQIFYPIGFVGGTAPATEYFSMSAPLPPALYVGFWWKPSNPWQGHSSGVNKILFVHPSDGSNIVLKMLGSAPPYHTQVTTEFPSGTTNWSENVDATPVALGQWHRLELYINYSGGVVKWWMDGQLKGSYTGLPYPGSGFLEPSFSPTWGGTGDVKTENDYYWIDHVHVSKP
jgi:uncharacterized protein YjdB